MGSKKFCACRLVLIKAKQSEDQLSQIMMFYTRNNTKSHAWTSLVIFNKKSNAKMPN